jgi:predicted acyl esterase
MRRIKATCQSTTRRVSTGPDTRHAQKEDQRQRRQERRRRLMDGKQNRSARHWPPLQAPGTASPR